MSGDAAAHVVEDFFGVVRLLSDGSVVRGDQSVLIPAETVPVADVPGVQWKDVVYDAARGLKVRVYRPPAAATAGEGGAELPAVVLSVQYRLAPEHRLPAAIDDGVTFLSWLGQQAGLGENSEPWLAESADFSRTFVSGVSAGANLAHHVVVRAASGQIELGPVRVVGYVLFSAFFGGVERVATETDPPAGVSLAVEMSDQLWRMALPVGATRGPPVGQPVRPGQP
ncbi:hypothetical protein PR202_gb26389 [Eleusine coracana subsp. coracana]|uniref:Alpha/beta hydrolase fold-3 domain-containing protein n=1 Tax=Eleusine coracana subsp. coracana TaxID=191504 RepID=A0AAV5FSG4_ELECO|nr:hypothetical protein PR202_gb26389 [Eleusine coracana subsp. coracana]